MWQAAVKFYKIVSISVASLTKHERRNSESDKLPNEGVISFLLLATKELASGTDDFVKQTIIFVTKCPSLYLKGFIEIYDYN